MPYPGSGLYPDLHLYPGPLGTGTISDRLVEAFEPWITDDLEAYLRSIAIMFTETELFGFDTHVAPGWTLLLDPDRCPPQALPYLAQYVGERLPVGISIAEQRQWIKDAPNQRRGTLSSIVRAAARTLIGDRHVVVRERDEIGGGGDDPDRISVITYDAETPRPDLVLADLITVIPADIVLNYQVLPGMTWSQILIDDPTATWQDVKDTYDTWRDLAENT